MLLFTPGSTPVCENIRDVMSRPTIHHRSLEFEEIFSNCREILKELYNMQEVIILSSAGSGAIESAMINLCHSKALIINSGKFGNRFVEIAEAFNIPYTEIKYDWDTPASVEDIQKVINQDHSIDVVFMQICESSGGVRHPSREIAKAVKYINSDITVVADGITAVGVERIDVKNIDCLIGASQKAFMLPAGLSMVGLSKDAIIKMEKNPKGFYFNLVNELEKQKQNKTQFTIATDLIIGLEAVLKKMKKDGFEKIYDEAKRRSIASKIAIEAIGLKLYAKTPADALTAILFDEADKLREILKTKYDVDVADGQDKMAGKMFRINHMGDIKPYKTLWLLNAIELSLDELKIRTYDGTATLAFSKVFYTKELSH